MIDDLRVAVRLLLRTPAFTLLATLTLALGIAANAAIFSVVRGVLLRPLPYPDAERIVALWTSTPADPRSAHSAGEFVDLQRDNASFAAMAGYRRDLFAVATDRGVARQYEGSYVTADFFEVFGVPARHGRVVGSADANAGERFVVLGANATRDLFATSPAVGTRVRLNGEPYTVAGVMPESFQWPRGSELWVLSARPVPPSPMTFPETDREVRYFDVVARLLPEVALDHARQDLGRLAGVLDTRRTAGAERRGLFLVPLHEELVGDVRAAILVLQAGVGVVLLIGCANVAGLVIARTAARRRELAVRVALGAGAIRLVRALLAESAVLGLLGGVVGLALGRWAVKGLLLVLPDIVPRSEAIALDGVVAAVAIAVAVIVSMIFAAAPALRASRVDAAAALNRAVRGSSEARARGRAGLVVAQVALTLVLLIAAGLLTASLVRLQRVDSGYRETGVSIASLAIPQTRYPTPEMQAQLYTRLLEKLHERPDIRQASVVFPAPLKGDNASGSFYVDGRPTPAGTDRPFAYLAAASAAYFETLGIPVLEGRTFNAGESAKGPGVAIVSAALARRYWPGDPSVGKRVKFDDDPQAPWITVIGVTADVRHLGLSAPPPPVMYLPYQQFTLPFTTVAMRSTQPPDVVAQALRSSLALVDPELAVDTTAPLDAVLRESMAEPQFRTAVFGSLGLVALVLAMVGLYGLISYSVGQQTREIGIRIALGAAPARIMWRVVGRALTLAVNGVAIGLVTAFFVTRVLARFLFGIDTTDAGTFAVMSALMLLVAIGASYVPARRALRVDPITALRAE